LERSFSFSGAWIALLVPGLDDISRPVNNCLASPIFNALLFVAERCFITADKGSSMTSSLVKMRPRLCQSPELGSA
jgi:hypothetical protein